MSSRLLETTDYATILRTFEWKALWELVDGTAERLNLAHECVDRVWQRLLGAPGAAGV